MAAQLNDDDDLADRILALQRASGEKPKPSEHSTEWSSVREGLARIEDAVHLLTTATLVAARIQNPPKIPPAARPTTAMQRARSRAAMASHTRLVEKLLPEGGE